MMCMYDTLSLYDHDMGSCIQWEGELCGAEHRIYATFDFNSAVAVWTRASCLADRGSMEHWNGFGWLQNGISQSLEASQSSSNAWSSHLIVPGVYSMTGSITFPFSTALLILKTANVIAMVANTVASAKCIPGHVLNTIDQSLAPYTCRIHWPPSESEYHATGISFYLLALWRNKPIGIKHLWTGIRLFITCHFPM